MIYFTTFITLILGLFIIVLIYFALSPQQAIFALFRRINYLMDSTRFGLLLRVHAPIGKTVLPNNDVVHCPYQLHINTYDRVGQSSHPDVVFVEHGFGPERWRYWMVVSPYPFGNDRYENPSIFVSNDGLVWNLPQGARNPIAAPPVGHGSHNSDPCLLYNSDNEMLWLYYRQSIKKASSEKHCIILLTSEDGVQWTEAVEVIADKTDTVISPTVIYENNQFSMWSVNNYSQPPQLTKRISIDGLNWRYDGISKVDGLYPGRSIWHLDILPARDRLHALFVTSEDGNGAGSRIHYGYSLDEGNSWIIQKYMLKQIHEFENALQYRGCLVHAEGHSNIFEVWYSAMSQNAVWTTVYLPMILENNNLLPLGSLNWKSSPDGCRQND